MNNKKREISGRKYPFIRQEKEKALLKWYMNGFEKKKLHYSEYENATILPLRKDSTDGLMFGKGGVICGDRYIPESGIEGRVGGYYPFQHTIYRDEKVVYCGAFIKQWGHFLIESVSRLWYSLESGEPCLKMVFIASENKGNCNQIDGNYMEFLKLLGLSDRIEMITTPVTFKNIIIPDLGYGRTYYYSDEYKRIFEKVSSKALEQCRDEGLSSHKDIKEKIFLSRSRFKKAIKNEQGLDLLDNYFSKNGYFVIHPEEIPLRLLIWYLRNAKICAAESGTLPHNFLFCQDEKEVVIVERQATVNEIQANIDVIKKLKVQYVDGHFMIYPTLAGYGPFFVTYNDCFEKFTKDKGYLRPDSYYLSERYLRKCLKKYLLEYRRAYGYAWGFERWQLMYMGVYYEAYEDSQRRLGPYLAGLKPLYFKEWFRLRTIKALIKKPVFMIGRYLNE